jgi:hypothetical protein
MQTIMLNLCYLLTVAYPAAAGMSLQVVIYKQDNKLHIKFGFVMQLVE